MDRNECMGLMICEKYLTPVSFPAFCLAMKGDREAEAVLAKRAKVSEDNISKQCFAQEQPKAR
jgi:hypothetical protein